MSTSEAELAAVSEAFLGDLRLIFEASPDVLLVLLPDAPRFTMIGATNARLAATHTTRETIGRPLFEVFPDNPDDPSATGTSNLRASLNRVLANRAPDTMAVQRYDIRGPDGTFQVKYWSPKNIPVLSKRGEILYILHRVEDVTELVEATERGEELRGRAREMEREILERSRELARARDTAEAANQELEAFSYTVAHDLRAPLRSIEGFSKALLEDYAAALDDEGKQYLSFVNQSAQQMTQLIDDLLAFSKVTRSELNDQEVNLSELARSAIARLQRNAPTRRVEVDIQDGLMNRGDPRLLAVVFENLLGNAWKFTSKRADARISFGAEPRDGHPVYVVRDNGAGFDTHFVNKLFGVFQRLHTTTEFEGTGIGLATVRRVVNRHGGRVWAEGAIDRGASFFFTLHEEGLKS